MRKLINRFELSTPLIFWYLPVGYLASVLAHSYQPALSQQTLRIHLLALLVTSFTIFYLYLGVRLCQALPKFKGPIGFSVIVTAGIVRGIVMYYLGNLLEIDSGLSLLARISVSGSATLFWLILFALVVNSHREYQANYRLLLSQALINRSAEINEVDLKAQLSQVETNLKSIQLNPEQDSEQSKLLIRIAAEVKAQIDDSIRPLSHRLWLAAVDEYPRVRIGKLITDSLRSLNYQLWIFVLLTVFISLTTLPTFLPTNEAIGRILIMVILILVIHYLFKLLESRFKKTIPLSITKLLLITFIPTGLGDLYYSFSRFPVENPISLVVYLITPVVLIALSIMELIKEDQTNLINSIAAKLEQIDTTRYQTQQVASYLHNSLQSELLAISKQLEQIAISQDELRSKEILEQLGGLINRSISEDFQNFYASPKERLLQVIENWRGILEINISNMDIIFELENKAIIAVQLIEELASNAIKHSQVTELNISCTRNQNKLILTVDTSANFGAAGLGSELMRSYLVSQVIAGPTNQPTMTVLEI